jgi:asparagine synthase (glutamine-hydrolysing)
MLFASELKALLRDPEAPRAMNHEALAFYLAYGYVPGARCLLQGFEKLPPATAMSVAFDGRVERTWKYWELPAPHGDRRPADAAAGGAHAMPALVDRYERLLAAAVERQLVSDVPLGVLLSGGLDSSLVTALAARVSPRKVRTFTVTFPGHPTHDEGPHARLVATHFATDHTELVAGAAAKDVVPALAYQFDEPIADSAIVPFTLLARLIRREATVALGGDGGDELFGGYPHYAWLVRAARAKALTPQLARRLVSRAAVALPAGTKGRHHLVGLKGDIGTSLAHINMYFDDASRRAAMRTTLPDGDLPEQWKAGLAAGVADVRDRAMRADFLSTMVDGYLVKVDRASMASGLEIRAPFLDHTLVEFAFAEVPADVKVSRDGRKLLSRALAARLLPAGFDAARKQGFTIPLSAWFTTGWDAYFAEVLTSDSDLVDPAFVAGLMAGQRAGRFNVERLFALTMLVLWRQAYGVSL